MAFSCFVQGDLALQLEALAICEAFLKALELCVDLSVVESDCKIVVDSLLGVTSAPWKVRQAVSEEFNSSILKMEKHGRNLVCKIFQSICHFLRRFLFLVLSFGPIPTHIAFIMDGNRRYAKKQHIKEGTGHAVGFATLLSVLHSCYEMGVKYVTVYAFSIDNFKRKPEEVQVLTDIMKEKIEELLEDESIVRKLGLRISFCGRLHLLTDPVRRAAEKAMASTAGNTGPVLFVCVAYTSTDEIARAIGKECARRIEGTRTSSTPQEIASSISVADLERSLDFGDCPEPDIVVRTSGESRLSNFLLWQTSFSHLQNPSALWPEFSVRHLIWSILEYQKVHPYLQARRRTASSKKDD
ncbi:dehydrodolichyl diphosphate synthase 6-like [Canna indica]|uniref:Alkyl transferase n=1 Tax=Canna indica TaxID=4628 RepID=A0AAQ3KQF8_9LILI|nr:dehydrodolichyl diphosphate synthase 6-like [Canna indica]